ncbi:hypothetical protein Fmac_024389 [Flemingia macrophylla]|uniref:Uncharacterized protein n=1 Tax=Flemingia macrophylla TaxID=520843 RepID=A0ABD1LP92_9FABA
MSGHLPFRNSGLRNLRVLNLEFNEIVGEITGSIESLDSLEVLDLASNALKKILVSLGNCGRLRTLLLYSNLLEEGIPVELGKLKSLEALDVSRNTLSGFMPKKLRNCLELAILVLSNLFDQCEDVIGRLGGVNDDLNYFEWTIHVEVLALPKLRILWSPMVNLEGSFQGSWNGGCESSEMVNLDQNFFKGEFPNQLIVSKRLYFLDLSSNNLTGKLFGEFQVHNMEEGT